MSRSRLSDRNTVILITARAELAQKLSILEKGPKELDAFTASTSARSKAGY